MFGQDMTLMTCIFPRTTGLPMAIWVSPRYGEPHDACAILVAQLSRPAIVRLLPWPHMVSGVVPYSDWHPVVQWIELNEAAIMDYWAERIDMAELAQRLRKLGEGNG